MCYQCTSLLLIPDLSVCSPHTLLLFLSFSIRINSVDHVQPLLFSCSPSSLLLSTWLIMFSLSLSLSLQATTWPITGDQYQAQPCRRTLSAATLDPCHSSHTINQTYATQMRRLHSHTVNAVCAGTQEKKGNNLQPSQIKI